MNLYEALKSGTDEQVLKDAFYKELEAATKKVAEEREAARKAAEQAKREREDANADSHLNSCRADFVKSLTDYLFALWGEPYSANDYAALKKSLTNEIYDYEKQIKVSLSLAKDFLARWDKIFESESESKSDSKEATKWALDTESMDADEMILNSFLKNL